MRDFRRMKLPFARHFATGNSPALDELFDLASVSSQLTSQFIEAEPISRHVSARHSKGRINFGRDRICGRDRTLRAQSPDRRLAVLRQKSIHSPPRMRRYTSIDTAFTARGQESGTYRMPFSADSAVKNEDWLQVFLVPVPLVAHFSLRKCKCENCESQESPHRSSFAESFRTDMRTQTVIDCRQFKSGRDHEAEKELSGVRVPNRGPDTDQPEGGTIAAAGHKRNRDSRNGRGRFFESSSACNATSAMNPSSASITSLFFCQPVSIVEFTLVPSAVMFVESVRWPIEQSVQCSGHRCAPRRVGARPIRLSATRH